MRFRVATQRRGIYIDPLGPEFSSEATTQRMLKELDERTAEAIERQLRRDQQNNGTE
jgi:regulator of sirC expression with transglutaminase-like and TPR domain